MSQLSFENLADWRALARIGLGGIDLYCRSFVRPPQRIILDMDDIDNPSRNSPLLRGDSHYCAEPPRWCYQEPCAATTPSASPGTIFPGRDDTHGHRRALHHHQLSKGAARRLTRSVLARERT